MKIVQVILVLSTIASAADCCSSQILLFNKETFRKTKQPFIDYGSNRRQPEYDKTDPAAATTTTTTTTTAAPAPAPAPASAVVVVADHHDQRQQQKKQQSRVDDQQFSKMRDVLSLECDGIFRTDFCLQGRCFRFPIGNQSFYSCECYDGYVGERCETKGFLPNDLTIELDFTVHRNPVSSPKVMNASISLSFPILLGMAIIHNMLGGGYKIFKRSIPRRKSLIIAQIV